MIQHLKMNTLLLSLSLSLCFVDSGTTTAAIPETSDHDQVKTTPHCDHNSLQTVCISSAVFVPNSSDDSNRNENTKMILLAQADGDKKKVRKRRLSTEGKFKRSGDKTTIDFDSVDIVGSRRTPLGSMINQSRANKDYDFVKVRLRWHPEMINSASSLDTGN